MDLQGRILLRRWDDGERRLVIHRLRGFIDLLAELVDAHSINPEFINIGDDVEGMVSPATILHLRSAGGPLASRVFVALRLLTGMLSFGLHVGWEENSTERSLEIDKVRMEMISEDGREK